MSLEDQLSKHIVELGQNSTEPVNPKLLEECEHFLVPQLWQDQKKLINIITSLSTLLSQLQQDPTPVIRLLVKLVEPFSFSDILTLQPPVDFVGGLHRDAAPYNPLMLSLLEKAARNVKDSAVLAGLPGVLEALVRLWLCTADMGIAERSASLLLDLLKIDKETVVISTGPTNQETNVGGQGLVWRRLFGDKDVYGLLYSIPSQSHRADKSLSKRDKTISQARLMSILPQIGLLDWTYISRSHHPEIEAVYGLKPDQGLVHFVSVYLVDYKDDVLLHINMLQYFADLIAIIKTPSLENPDISVALKFLIEQKAHDHALAFWLNPESPDHDPVDLSLLYAPSAHYLSIYASNYQQHFLFGTTVRTVLQRLHRSLDISPNQWASGRSPADDLGVLGSLPRQALLPQSFLGLSNMSSPLLLVPCKSTHEDALRTLARIFGGPREVIFPTTPASESAFLTEKRTARLLFHYYISTHDTFFVDTITHAETTALPAKALAAISILSSLVSASWAPLSSTLTDTDSRMTDSASIGLDLPSESSLQKADPSQIPMRIPYIFNVPSVTLLFRQPARDSLLPYLLRPPRTFGNAVGGADPESAIYRIAMAKWDLLLLLQRKIAALISDPEAEGVDETQAAALGVKAVGEAIERRVRQGPWGGEGQEVGGRIATLEL